MSKQVKADTQSGVTESPESLDKLAISILEGDVDPPNDVIAFIVPRAKRARREGQELMLRASQLKDEMQAIQIRVAEIKGVTKQYVDDVKACLIQMEKEKTP